MLSSMTQTLTMCLAEQGSLLTEGLIPRAGHSLH